MGITGPPPKDGKVRANKDTFAITELTTDGVIRGPELPDDINWHPRTKVWWEMWRCSAQAQVMEESDWEHMLETAFIHTRFWQGRDSSAQMSALAGELRRRAAALGSTFEDRLKLRMKIDGPAPEITDDEITAMAADGYDLFERLKEKAAKLAEDAKDN